MTHACQGQCTSPPDTALLGCPPIRPTASERSKTYSGESRRPQCLREGYVAALPPNGLALVAGGEEVVYPESDPSGVPLFPCGESGYAKRVATLRELKGTKSYRFSNTSRLFSVVFIGHPSRIFGPLFVEGLSFEFYVSKSHCYAPKSSSTEYDCAMANTPDDVDVPSATPEALLHKIGTLWILFGAMITSLGNDDPNLIDRMLTVLERTKPIGMFSEDALADALHFVRGLVKRPS